KHDMESDAAANPIKEVVFDPTLNEAVAIGDGVEQLQKSHTDVSFSDTDRSEFLKSARASKSQMGKVPKKLKSKSKSGHKSVQGSSGE
ncbi:hypothetical protein PFISCL1PPCAC_21091, partial [Pristionchus fissidentatus]